MKIRLCLALLALAGPFAAPAGASTDHHAHGAASAPQGQPAPLSEGTVRKIDKAAGKLTIAHGPLHGLGMPAMTMVFRVKDPAMLEKLAAGDKIRFQADRVNGVFTVTELHAGQ